MHKIILLLAAMAGFVIFSLSASNIQAQDDFTIEVGMIPPTPGETPGETLNKCLEWTQEEMPLPWRTCRKDCIEVVGYYAKLIFTAVEGMEGLEPGDEYSVDGYVGEVTDYTTTLGQYNLISIHETQPQDYLVAIEGYFNCVEPMFDVYSERNAIDAGESTNVIIHLNCDLRPMGHEIIILEVVSGPGELELPPIDPDNYMMLGSYQDIADKIVYTDYANGKAEVPLTATGEGLIEVKATYSYCTVYPNDPGAGELVQTIQVRVGKWVSIDCTYATDPDRFGSPSLQWGGTIHTEVCLETIEEEVYGYNVTRLGGQGHGTQDCWVEPGPDEWIENLNCSDFEAPVCSGMVWPDTYNFMLDMPDSSAITFDIVYNEGRSRLSNCEYDPIRAMETAISLGFSPDDVFTYSGTDVLLTEYTITARWIN